VAFARSNPCAQRTAVATGWMRLAGLLACVADIATQGANAARQRDPTALAALMFHLRVAILDAIRLHNISDCFDDEVKP
jgi:hypothetical protein